jgi:hypothetical protein
MPTNYYKYYIRELTENPEKRGNPLLAVFDWPGKLNNKRC